MRAAVNGAGTVCGALFFILWVFLFVTDATPLMSRSALIKEAMPIAI